MDIATPGYGVNAVFNAIAAINGPPAASHPDGTSGRVEEGHDLACHQVLGGISISLKTLAVLRQPRAPSLAVLC